MDRARGFQPALPENDDALTTASKSALAAVGAAGMKARNRGLSRATVAGTITVSKRRNASATPSPSSVMVAAERGGQRVRSGGGAEWRPAGQAVGHEAVGQCRQEAGVVVEAVHRRSVRAAGGGTPAASGAVQTSTLAP